MMTTSRISTHQSNSVNTVLTPWTYDTLTKRFSFLFSLNYILQNCSCKRILNSTLWLWRWLPHRLSKRQSLSTTTVPVLFWTTFTPNEHTEPTYEMTAGFKTFTKWKFKHKIAFLAFDNSVCYNYGRERARWSVSFALIGYLSGQDGSILPARDFPLWSREKTFSFWLCNKSFIA